MERDSNKNRLTEADELRRLAEERLLAKRADLNTLRTEEDSPRLVHELEVHLIELEMQNEDLRKLRDQAEKTLEKYTDLYDFAPVGYCTLNHDGAIQDSNFTAADLLGIERSMLTGRHFGLLVAPEFRPLFAEFFAKVLDATSKVSCDVKLSHEGPVPCYVRLEARIGSSEQEVRLAIINISGRKRAEEKFHSTRMRLAWVLEKTRIGMWLNELPLGRLTWDEQTRSLFFIEPESEATIELFWSRIHPDDREPTRLAVEKAIRDNTLYEIEHRAVHPSTGEIRWIHSAGQATYAADGTPTHFDGINYDISDRKRAEEALHEVEELNDKTLQALPAHIAVVDHLGQIIAVNQAWTDFAENNQAACAHSVAVGTNYIHVCQLAADDNDAEAGHALQGIEAVLDGTCEQFTSEYPCHTPQQQQWFLMTAVPLSGGKGGAVITHTNITARMLAEEELKKSHNDLEVRVRERTAELTQEIEERKKAEISLKDAYSEIKRLKNQLQAENIYLQQEVDRSYNFGEIIGQSIALTHVFSQVEQVAPMNATVLLLG
jgi:PAS domain S-box-containing protein